MRTLIEQIRKAAESRLYYLALMSALTIPDIAGALESANGIANGRRYAAWYERWVRPRLMETRGRENPFSGWQCYGFRCAMLHQARSQRDSDAYSNIMFIEPGHPHYGLHYCLAANTVLLIQLDEFVGEVLLGCELWLAAIQGTDPFEKNYRHFARRHPDGLAPYIVGGPVIG